MCLKNLMRFNLSATRMHSSRMRTVRCSSRLLWGVCPGGVSAQGVSTQGVSDWGGMSARGCLPDTPPPPVDRMADACENITLPQLRCGR